VIHPQHWSLSSIWKYLHNRDPSALSKDDIAAYSLLPVRGKVVLDIGAYDGDTAELFLRLGAKRVICIEPNFNRYMKIVRNLCYRGKPVIADDKQFDETDLKDYNWDCMKMDCEGYEALLYERGWHKYIQDRPVVLEAHNWHVKEELEKIGFTTIKTLDPMLGLSLMANFSVPVAERGRYEP